MSRWRVVEPLGMAGDHYALKLALHAHDGRAEREVALMMAPAVHPNVVRFHGCARWPHPREGCLGFLMDWVPGLALDVWAETGGVSFRRLARVGAIVPTPPRERGPWRTGLLLAGMGVLTCGALSVLRYAPGLLGGGATSGADARSPASGMTGPTPWKNQKRAPCTPKLEVEYSGVC